jgi:CHAT domain-containing protein
MAVLVIQGVALTSAFNVCAVERNLPVETFAESLLQINREQEVVTLELGRSVERELAGGQEHSFQITLTEGQFARVISEQRGIDLVVTLFGVDGKSIADFDADITNHGEETTELVADRAGTYRLLVKPRYPKLPIGSYRIEWVEAHDATENDRLSHEARRLLAESKRLSDAGKYTDALMPAERALELRERISGRQHPDLYHPLLNLFVVNFLNGNYAKAEAFCARALTITENALGPEHPLVARLLYNLAVLYSTTGDDSRAELFVQRALSIQAKALGPDHPHIAQSLNRLAVLLRNRGDFVRAELLFQQALAISEKALGDDDEDVAQSLNTLAGLYREKGDYTKAEPLYVRSLNISEKKRGSDHPYLAAPLHNLATLYRDMGEFDKGERLYQRSITIREKATGPNHPNVAGSRASLALLYYMRGDYAKAEPLYLSALAILEKALGSNHPLVAWYLSKLGNLYVALNDDAKAESLFRRALGIYEAAYGTNSYYLADILLELAKMSAVEGKLKEAIAFQARANEITEYHINLNIFTGSERQKLAYLAKWPEQMNQAISLHVRLAADNPMARELAATAVLQRKGRVQDALSLSLASLHSRFSAEEQGLLDQWNAATSRVARLVLNEPQGISPAEHQKQIRTLQERREKLESEISSRNTAFYENARPITLAAVQAAIPEKAALVEFAIYRPFDPKAPHKRQSYGESRYIAYVLHHQGPTEWVELGEAKTIDDAVSKLRRALHDPSRKDVQRLARDLDQKLMRPVRALTYDATQLLISPDGDLNLIPFEALVDEQGRYLVERYAFAYLTSGRDLLRLQTARKSKTPPVVFADPAFGDPALIASSNGSSITSAPSRSQFNYSQIFFGPLPGVGDEVRTLKTLLPQATFFTRNEASEANLKHVSAPSILHVATHGFFLENESSAKDRTTVKAADLTRLGKWAVRVENPLLRSGLALAGVNQGGNGDDDGVLTALEASALDLWGTKLVVLSACDTGVGEVKNGEGVYGLRRALFLAGTESQLMSLWPVSDRSTRQLMAGYYQALVQNAGRAEALRQVRLKMLRNKPRSHPYYWASFILAGEWANLKGQR